MGGQLVSRVSETVAAGGLAAVGLEWCLLATDEKAVQHLLVQDNQLAPGMGIRLLRLVRLGR